MVDDGKGASSDVATDDTVVELPEDRDANERSAARLSTRNRALAVGDRLGRYELEEELGEGGMATVYRARDVKLRRSVAVKVLFPHLAKRPEIVARFQREARAAAALDHDHVLRVFDVGGGAPGEGGDDPPYIVLELATGPSLDEFAAGQPILAEVVAAIGVFVCDGLQCAHDAGIIHRDLKPANVMITDGGRLVLGDFGVAYAEDDSLVTQTGALLGTPAFMAPEQALGSEMGAAADLYSLGATLYRLATGALPNTGPTAKIVAGILHGDRPSAQRRWPQVGPELDAVIERLMQREPADRFQTATEARAALLEIAAPLGEDLEAVLRSYFEDRQDVEPKLRAKAIAATLERARSEMAAGRRASAMALAGRVVELDGDNTAALALIERGHARSRGLKGIVVLTSLAVLGAGAAFFMLREGEHRARAAASLLADAGSIRADAAVIEPVIVVPSADAAPQQRSPVDAGRRKTEVVRRQRVSTTALPSRRPLDAGPQPDARAVAAAARQPAPPELGVLEVSADTWCDLSIDGRGHGRQQKSPRRFELPVGRHKLFCSQGAGRPSKAGSATVEGGRVARIRLTLIDEVAVAVRLSTGRAVRIGRRRLANGTSLRLRPGRYKATVELPGGGRGATGWVAVTAATPCVLRDRPTLGCFSQ